MTVNLEKTATQTFSLAHQTLLPDLKYRDVALIHTSKFNYLGVTLDNKLNWKSRIESISNRFLKRVSILKRLAGFLWVCDRSTLNVTYKTFIQPLITYCREPLIAANEQVLQKLELLQNQVLRLITGAVKSTPINAMLLLTNNKPIKTIIKEKALILYDKLIRTENPYWINYPTTTRNLKTQKLIIRSCVILSSTSRFEFNCKQAKLNNLLLWLTLEPMQKRMIFLMHLNMLMILQ
ncbi:uncharacterized protein CEXT_301761 [Caerostris extrusa]|uniref:Uncharacterized protein n=1 Tax=Caerostris extrusa TaxID=172846 RepID=A0AAV4S8H6_CAEEX|nr:uncharacterized protein CEXT_301761 [Caerostris extrusa]